MRKALNDFFKKYEINSRQKIILSMDLDNTLIIREKGSNYVNPELKKIIGNLIREKRIILIPNTGRELVGFSSFKKRAFNCRNGILCSGSLVLYNNQTFFNKKSEIDKASQEIFLNAIKRDKIPFADFSYTGGRIVIYNNYGLEYKDLFYSQNPADWFGKKLPPCKHVNALKREQLKNVFRIEFPVMKVYPNHRTLLSRLLDKREENINELTRLLSVRKIKAFGNYSVKRKVFFNDNYCKDDLIFARFGKLTTFTNKGIGLRIWLGKTRNLYKDHIVIHIGDQDTGLINDTLIKDEVPNALIVMVGECCSLNNPSVDLYLRGDTEKYMLIFFRELSRRVHS